MVRLQIIGGGRMGEALLSGLLTSGHVEVGDVAVVETAGARRTELLSIYPGLAVSDVPVPCAGAVIAVKPDDVVRACLDLGVVGVERVLSIAAGITLGQLQEALPDHIPVVRAMPNTPALVGAGAAAIAGNAAATEDDLTWAESLLDAVGVVVRTKESLLDAVTGLSGSGPAYVFLVAEAMIDAGVLVGLPRDMATTLAAQTLLGAARMVQESGDNPADLRAAVTSPGGTTAAGLRELERAGVRAAFLAAVEAATARSQQLGRRS